MRGWLGGAVIVVVLSNAAALWRAYANRQGEPEARVTLGPRELYVDSHGSDNSGVSLLIRYESLPNPEAMGVDCNAKTRQEDWIAFAALEFDGESFAKLPPIQGPYQLERPRLVVVAVAHDPAQLRARYPDRSRVLILPVTLYRYGVCIVRKVIGQEIYLPREQARLVEGSTKAHATIVVGRRYEPWVEDPRPE